MISGENLKRLINFSDAIVAVAITLLVIPLTDTFQNIPHDHLLAVLESSAFVGRLANFLISFFVIYSIWEGHHQLFESIETISRRVAKLNQLWLLSVILIPATTMINMVGQGNLGIYIYGGSLMISLLILQIIKAQLKPGYDIFKSSILTSLMIALLLITIFPQLGYFVYYILLLSIPLKRSFPKLFAD